MNTEVLYEELTSVLTSISINATYKGLVSKQGELGELSAANRLINGAVPRFLKQ